jgi:hypothetical protein
VNSAYNIRDPLGPIKGGTDSEYLKLIARTLVRGVSNGIYSEVYI